MLNSMTGYGKAEGEIEGKSYIVEIRAVNNRFFKSRVNLPDSVVFLEGDIVKLLREELSRGMVTLTVRVKDSSEVEFYGIDEQVLRRYLEEIKGVTSGFKDLGGTLDIGGLLGLPGVLKAESTDEQSDEEIAQLILKMIKEAIDDVKQMQQQEGKALKVDLEKNWKSIEEDLERILERRDEALSNCHLKLKERVDELLEESAVQIDQASLAREIAVFAERSDIAEEITRLKSHLEQFQAGCEGKRQSGRRLDFLTQEMLREANTIASKSSDEKIIQHVVDIKCRIDKIKEQVQNVK